MAFDHNTIIQMNIFPQKNEISFLQKSSYFQEANYCGHFTFSFQDNKKNITT